MPEPVTAVEVAVPRPVWRTYTYLMPREMADGTLEGCRVEVPFGRERLRGWIWDRSTAPSGIDLKYVESRLDSVPLVPPSVLALVRWAADYYAAPPGMMLASAFPAASGIRMSVRATGRPAPDGPPPMGLIGSSFVPVDDLLPGFQSRSILMSHLSELEAAGHMESRFEPARRRVDRQSLMVVPALPPDELAGMAVRLRRRARAQASILEILSRSSERVLLGTLLREADASRASLEALVKAGAATIRPAEPAAAPDPAGLLAGRVVESLEPGQDEALDRISRAEGGVFLLHGVTGSGKTEVYLRAIADSISKGRQAVVLVPEISLTPQLMARFESRFPGKVAVMHSALSPSERTRAWCDLSSGERSIAIGPRSAVFAPLRRVGMIIVDEEHDPSYKQQELPRYNARDLAVIRGSVEGVPVVLGSATPSLESWGNASSGRYGLLTLPSRIGSRPMPEVRAAVPPRSDCEAPPVPAEMVEELAKNHEAGGQAILLLNRRGFSPSRICRSCGRRETCPDCGISPTFHSRGGILRCHHCGWWIKAPVRCPGCGGGSFRTDGPGVQKVEAFLAKARPGLRVMRMDRDTVSSPGANWEILARFARREADVLLGTQMVAKGHDFPGVTLVGILAADLALAFPDFRASERAFQLVMQAAGRAGRGEIPGRVLVETSDPEAFAAAMAQDYASFLASELPVRKLLGYPPFGHLVRFVWSGPDERRVAESARKTMAGLEVEPAVRLLPPAPAIMQRLRGRWRYSALARSARRPALRRLIPSVRDSFEKASPKGVQLDVDVDPVDLL
ncbi:MAG TPA: primosomal protein N' [Candidatus Fermentibacter daniensis]|nr:primosomal protein N' [Candidatus Fermentibacter daniensis]